MQTLDTLTAFHLHNPDHAAHSYIAHLIDILSHQKELGLEGTWRNIENILGDAQANRILQLICQHHHVDYQALLGHDHHKICPKLLLHLTLLPVSFVAQKLQIDEYWATQLLDQLHKHFTIDNPLRWLQGFLHSLDLAHHRQEIDKRDLLLGRDCVSTPQDTAEYRKRKNHLNAPAPKS